MAPSTSAVSAQLRQVVYYHLDNLSYDNALFFAERLVAHDPRSSESVYLLALSHFRLGDYQSAYEVSKAVGGVRGSNINCVFIFAQTCLVIERYKEGIQALERSRNTWSNKVGFCKHGPTTRSQYPDAATMYCLLGKLYRGYDDKKKAVSSFEEALKANPFMWDAFTSLCDMGVNLRTQNVFKLNDILLDGYGHDAGNGVLSEQKDNTASHPADILSKRAHIRQHAVLDAADPFDPQKPSGTGNSLFGASSAPFANGENDFLSKIAAARSRMATTTVDIDTDIMETPTTSTVSDNGGKSFVSHAEQPQVLTRKPRALATDSGLQDAPLKIGRLGAKRALRAYDKAQEDVQPEGNHGTLRVPSGGVAGIERKRTVSGHPVQPRQHSEEPGAPQRRSARINMSRNPNIKIHATTAAAGGATRELKKARPPIPRLARPTGTTTTVGRAVSGNRKPFEDSGMDVDHAEAPRVKEPPVQQIVPKAAEPDYTKVEEALRHVLDLLRKFGAGYLAQSQYQCLDALSAYNALPKAQQDTPWVLSQMGRAHYEQASYAEAEKYYRRLRILAPTRFEDMEVYSTILWFLKRETELSFLAHELVDGCWRSPHAWCALGNAWSLARDHEQALRCFKRATQLDPKFAYAFTLQGHEHVSNEEYEKALVAYRQALSADRRHYNAYYGIGRVYEKLGNYDQAYTHFHSASVINPTNAVLICCIGNVLEKQRQLPQALQYFSKATELAPQAAQTRYKKARALLALNQLEAAQRELEILKNLAPDEATVHFLLGKLYKSQNDKSSAVRHFTIALNLDPKASQQIKEAIESLEDDDDGYDDSMMG